MIYRVEDRKWRECSYFKGLNKIKDMKLINFNNKGEGLKWFFKG